MTHKFLTLLLMSFFLLTLVSAVEWDNYYTYDETTKTATIRNGLTLGSEIATIRLLTPQEFEVQAGYNYVLELGIWGAVDYQDFVREMNFHNRTNGMAQFNRDYDLKFYDGTEEYNEEVYKCIYYDNILCSEDNSTINITRTREVWTKLTPADLKKNDYMVVRLYTDVKEGDNVEWYGNFFGAGLIEEWATWTSYAALTTGLATTGTGFSTISMFNETGRVHGIVGEFSFSASNIFTGYTWNGGGWVSNDTIKNGLSTPGDYTAKIDTFWFGDNELYALVGADSGNSFGFVWNGSGWDANSTISGGIADVGGRASPEVFLKDGTYYLIIGNASGGYTGYNWSGTTWQRDHYINQSLVLVPAQATISVVNFSSNYYLIVGRSDGLVNAYYWNTGNNSWTRNSTLENGIADPGTDTFPELYPLTSNASLIMGAGDGTWDGYTSFLSESATDNPPVVTLVTPANDTTLNTNSISQTFTCKATDDNMVDELTFYLWNKSTGALITTTTNSTPLNNTNTQFSYTLMGGTNYSWNCLATDNLPQSAFATNNWTINVIPIPDNAPNVEIGAGSTANNTQSTTSPYTLVTNCSNIYDDNIVDNVSLILESAVKNTTAFPPNNSNQVYNNNIFADGNYSWYCKATDNATQETLTGTYNLLLDANAPTITYTEPLTTYGILYANDNLNLNVSISDLNIDRCWYGYNNTNTTISCVSNNTFSYSGGKDNLTIYANDTFGNVASQFVSWNVQLFEYESYYINETVEGTNNLFWVKIGTNESVRKISLVYNGTENLASLSELGSDIYNGSVTLTSNGVDVSTNYSFYWSMELISGTVINLSTNYQIVNPIQVDDCSTFNNTLINFTIKDEEDFTILGNTTLEFALKVYDTTKTLQVINYSTSTTNNPYAVCLNGSLGASTLLMDSTIQYTSDGYFNEFYHIRNYTLTESTRGQNISLYPLNESDGQEFKITYKNSDFKVVPNALIQISRRFLNVDDYYIVEIAKNGDDGTAIGHFVINDVIYRLVFIDVDGTILAQFDDVTAKCQNPSFEDCEINVNSFSSGVSVVDYNNTGSLSANLQFDRDTRTVSSTFISTSGVNSEVVLNVTLFDNIGNTQICTDSVVATSGSLSCLVPENYGNVTIMAKLYGDDVQIKSGIISIKDEPKDIYGFNIVFLAMFLFLTIVGMSVSDSPMNIGIFSVLGFVLLIGMNLVYSPSWFGTSASLIGWLVVSVVIIFIKSGGRQ